MLARALFEEGVTLADGGNWAGAADRFGRAHELKPTPGIAFNWGSALVATGKLTQASELLEGVLRDPNATDELKQESEQKLAEIGRRRARLRVRVDASLPAGCKVLVDGNDWPRAVWDVALPIDPGAHVAIAQSEGRELARATVRLREGQELEVRLATPAANAATQLREGTRDGTTGSRPLYKNWILWTAVGVAVVGGAVAVALLTRDDSHGAQAPVAGNTGAGVITW